MEAEKSLNGYIAFIRKQGQGGPEYGHNYVREEQAEYSVFINPAVEEDIQP
jgi:hypothetical protein